MPTGGALITGGIGIFGEHNLPGCYVTGTWVNRSPCRPWMAADAYAPARSDVITVIPSQKGFPGPKLRRRLRLSIVQQISVVAAKLRAARRNSARTIVRRRHVAEMYMLAE